MTSVFHQHMLASIQETVDTVLQQQKGVRDDSEDLKLHVVCYGIGSFTESAISQYQMGLFLSILERFKVGLHFEIHLF